MSLYQFIYCDSLTVIYRAAGICKIVCNNDHGLLDSFQPVLFVCLCMYTGEMGIVYKGQLIDWNSVPLQGVAVKTLKGGYLVEGDCHIDIDS